MPMTANGLTKMLEETGELAQVGAKRLAYFTTLVHPDGAGDLKTRMEEEIAEVEAFCDFVKGAFELDRDAIGRRRQLKFALFTKWHADPTNGSESFHGARDEKRAVEEVARRANDEAQAEQGAGWRAAVEARLRAWRQSFVDRSGDRLALDDFMDEKSLNDLIQFVCSMAGVEDSIAHPVGVAGQLKRGPSCVAGASARRRSDHYPEEWGPKDARRLTCACGNPDPGHLDRESKQGSSEAQAGGMAGSAGYTVISVGGVTLVRGNMPITDFVALSKAAPKDAVVSAHLARLAGVDRAWGKPAAVSALQEQLTAQWLSEHPGSSALQRWVAVGRRGSSSDAIAAQLTGEVYAQDPKAHPHDADDLCRCVEMLDQVPELRGKLQQMSSVSAVWAALVAEWTTLELLLREEAGERWGSGGWRAPRTHEAIRRAVAMASESQGGVSKA